MSKKAIVVSGGELDEELTVSILARQEDRCVIGVDKLSLIHI